MYTCTSIYTYIELKQFIYYYFMTFARSFLCLFVWQILNKATSAHAGTYEILISGILLYILADKFMLNAHTRYIFIASSIVSLDICIVYLKLQLSITNNKNIKL